MDDICTKNKLSPSTQKKNTLFSIHEQGIARTQSPTNKNYALELPTFGVIVGVSQSDVQWKSLTLRELPSGSQLTLVPGKYAG